MYPPKKNYINKIKRIEMNKLKEKFLKKELKNVKQYYINLGLSEEKATKISQILGEDPNSAIQVILKSKNSSEKYVGHRAWKHGLFTFSSFLFFGFSPILCYVVFAIMKSDVDTTKINGNVSLLISIGVSIVCIFLLGMVRAKYAESAILKTALLIVVFACVAAAVGYVLGLVLVTTIV